MSGSRGGWDVNTPASRLGYIDVDIAHIRCDISQTRRFGIVRASDGAVGTNERKGDGGRGVLHVLSITRIASIKRTWDINTPSAGCNC